MMSVVAGVKPLAWPLFHLRMASLSVCSEGLRFLTSTTHSSLLNYCIFIVHLFQIQIVSSNLDQKFLCNIMLHFYGDLQMNCCSELTFTLQYL